MIAPPAGVKIWLAAGVTDMRRGFDGLAAVVAQQLKLDPFSGAVFIFRGRREQRHHIPHTVCATQGFVIAGIPCRGGRSSLATSARQRV